MIQGIGVDIIDIGRFHASINRFGSRLLTKIFTDDEIGFCSTRQNPEKYFAARFAAKEAMSKALATGHSGIFTWKSVEVFSRSDGKPLLRFHHHLAEHLTPYAVHFSLSMSDTRVVATVILLDRPAAA